MPAKRRPATSDSITSDSESEPELSSSDEDMEEEEEDPDAFISQTSASISEQPSEVFNPSRRKASVNALHGGEGQSASPIQPSSENGEQQQASYRYNTRRAGSQLKQGLQALATAAAKKLPGARYTRAVRAASRRAAQQRLEQGFPSNQTPPSATEDSRIASRAAIAAIQRSEHMDGNPATAAANAQLPPANRSAAVVRPAAHVAYMSVPGMLTFPVSATAFMRPPRLPLPLRPPGAEPRTTVTFTPYNDSQQMPWPLDGPTQYHPAQQQGNDQYTFTSPRQALIDNFAQLTTNEAPLAPPAAAAAERSQGNGRSASPALPSDSHAADNSDNMDLEAPPPAPIGEWRLPLYQTWKFNSRSLERGRFYMSS